MSVNFFYILIIFISSISFSIYIIIPNINRISFWIRYHIIISGITNIELNIIITDYENLSEQINLIIFFIIIRVYVPFIITYFYIKTVGIIEIQYNFHWGYFIYSFIYMIIISVIYNHYDFAYSTFIDIVLPYIVQKCLDFSLFFSQYKGYFYDFFFIFFIYISCIHILFIYTNINFYLKSNDNYSNHIKRVFFRFISYISILYYFGSHSYFVNTIILISTFICRELFYILIRIFAFIHMITFKTVRNSHNISVKIN